MPDTTTILDLLQTALDTGAGIDDLCREHPHLAARLRHQWERVQALDSQVDALFPTPSARSAAHRPSIPRPGLPDIPGHTVESVLGRGGMGVVYRARHIRLNRPVAIKMLLAGPFAAPRELDRLLKEAESVAALRHPNIVQVFEVGEHEGQPYYTMEFIEGGTLSRALGGAPQPPRDAASMVATLARAIETAHSSKIVHRDLKPSNILLMHDGSPKVADFGLARSTALGPEVTVSGAHMGSPSYMAPEQAAGAAGAFCPAVDIYALGAILYEMLTGRPPFRAQTTSETHLQVLTAQPARPTSLNPAVPRDLETICLKCLHKEPERRYPSALELALDLDRFGRGEPIVARPVGRPERAARWVRRNPVPAALFVAVVMLIVIGTAYAAREWNLSIRRRAEAANWGPRLEFVIGLQREGRFGEARAILGRVPDGGSQALRSQIAAAQSELSLIEALDVIQMRRAHATGRDLDRAATDHAYAAAFQAAGLAEPGDDPAAVAARISALKMHAAVIAAVDNWAFSTHDKGRLEWLLAVARAADPDPAWRDQVRDLRNWASPAELAKLAGRADPSREPIPLMLVLAGLLQSAGEDAEPLLRRVQREHPDDFWTCFILAELLDSKADPRAIEYYRAAVSLRPASAPARVNLAIALGAAGRAEESLIEMQRAASADPMNALARYNLAVTLFNLARFPEAIDESRAAVRIDPLYTDAHALLGHALLAAGKPSDAEPALTTAIDLMSADDPRRANAVRALDEARRSPLREERRPW